MTLFRKVSFENGICVWDHLFSVDKSDNTL